jgi:multiple sugar transport system ATP-binding protein
MNFVDGQIDGANLSFAGHRLALPPVSPVIGGDGSVILGIRPTDFDHDADASPDRPRITVTPSVVEDLGAETYLVFPVDAARVVTDATRAAADAQTQDEGALLLDDQRALFTARVNPRHRASVGQPIVLAIDIHRLHFFDPQTGTALTGPSQAEAGSPATT